jgi:hypothetical protein
MLVFDDPEFRPAFLLHAPVSGWMRLHMFQKHIRSTFFFRTTLTKEDSRNREQPTQ